MRTGTKKFVSVGMTVVYLHVNVLCAAPIGASPEPATAANSVRRFLTGALQPRQKPDPVFSFHADPIVPVPPPVERPARDVDRAAPAPAAPVVERVGRSAGIRNAAVRDAIAGQLGDRPLDQLTVRDLVAAGLVPPARQQELAAAGLLDQRVSGVIQIDGQLEFRITKPDAFFSVNVNLPVGQADISKADVSVTRTARAALLAPVPGAQRPVGAYDVNAALTRALAQRGADGQPVLRRLANGEFAARMRVSDGHEKTVILRRDGETLVPVALVGPGGARQPITRNDLVFRSSVNGQTVNFGIHHVEIAQDGGLIVHATGGLGVGQTIRDGNVNEGAGRGGANGRPQPRTGQGEDQAVSGYDLRVASSGRISLVGREENARFAFSFGIQSGTSRATVTPLTALAQNVRIVDGMRHVVATSGDLGQIQGGSGAIYQFSNWSVAPNLPAGGRGENLIRHFGISPDSSPLVTADGRAGAGRVERNPEGALARIVLSVTPEGQQAARDIFTNNAAAFAPGARLNGVPVAMEGPAGRASIVLATGADPARIAGAVRRMESFDANGRTGAQIDAFFKDVAATPGVARYQTTSTIQHFGRPVTLLISGRGGINGNVTAPTVTSDHPPVLAVIYGGGQRAMAAPGHLSDIGLGIDAVVTDSAVQHRFNPATGKNEFSGDGNINFRTADGVTGTVRVEGGEVQTVRLQGGAAGGAVNFGPGPGEPPTMILRVAADSDQTFDRRTGELTGDLRAGLQVQDVRHGVTVNLTNGAAGKIDAAVVSGNILQAFGQDAQVSRVSLENGSLRMDLVERVNVNGDIRLGDVAANPNARLRSASIATVSIDVFPGLLTGTAGALTGYGRSRIDARQEVYVPDGGAGGRGISAGGESANLRIRRAEDGKGSVVTAVGARERIPGIDPTSQINVQIQENRGPDGAYHGQATIQTAGARNLITQGSGVRLGDRTYNRAVRIDTLPADRSRPGEVVQTITALQNGAGFARDNGDSVTIRTPGNVPQTLTYVNGQLRALAGDTGLTNVTLVVNGTRVGFEMIPGALRPDGTRPQVAAPILQSDIDVLGTAVPRGTVRDVRLEDGKIVVELARPVSRIVNGAQARADRPDGTTEVAGPAVDNQRIQISRITLDPGTGNVSYRGAMAVTGETRVVRGDRPQRPDGRTPPPADPDRQPGVPDVEAVASRNVEFQDQPDGTSLVRPANNASDAQVGVTLTVTRDGRSTKPPAFQVLGPTDFSRNVGTFGTGANLLGTRWSAGVSVDVGVLADSNYNVRTPTGAVGRRTVLRDGQEKVETIESAGGLIAVRGGSIVARGRGTDSPTLDAVRGLGATAPTGRHAISGEITENPDAVAGGLIRERADKEGVVVIENGVVQSVEGIHYRNPGAGAASGEVLLETNDGKPNVTSPTFTVVEGGTSFVDSGLLSLGNARYDITSRVGGGGIRVETRVREDADGGAMLTRGHGRVDEFQVVRIDAANGGTSFGTFYERRMHNGNPQGGLLVGGATPLDIVGPGFHLRSPKAGDTDDARRDRTYELIGADGRAIKAGSFTFRGVRYDLSVRRGERGEPDTSVFVADKGTLRAAANRPGALILDTNGMAHRGTVTEAPAVRTGPMEERRSAYFHIALEQSEVFHLGEDGDAISVQAVKLGLTALGQPDRNVTMFDYAIRYQDAAPHKGGEHDVFFLSQDHRGLHNVASLGPVPGAQLPGGRIGWYDGILLRQYWDKNHYRIETVFGAGLAAEGSEFAAAEPGLRDAIATRRTEVAAARRALEANPADRTLLRRADAAEGNLREATGELDNRQARVSRVAFNDDRIRVGVVMYMPVGSVDLRQNNPGATRVGGERIDIPATGLIAIREGDGDRVRYSLAHGQRSPSGRFTILSGADFMRGTRANEWVLNGTLRAQNPGDAIRIGQTNGSGDKISLTDREPGGGGDLGPRVRQPEPERAYIRRNGSAVEIIRGDVVVKNNSLGVRDGTVFINEAITTDGSLRRVTVVTRENDSSGRSTNHGYCAAATLIDVNQNERGDYDAGAVRTQMARRFPKDAEFQRNEIRERTTYSLQADGTTAERTVVKEQKGRSVVILDPTLRTVGVAGFQEERAHSLGSSEIRNIFNISMVINQDSNRPENSVQIVQNSDRNGFSSNTSEVVWGRETTQVFSNERKHIDADGNEIKYDGARLQIGELYWKKPDGSRVVQDGASEAIRVTLTDRNGNDRLDAAGRPISFIVYGNVLSSYATEERMANGDEDKIKDVRARRDSFLNELRSIGTGHEPRWAGGDIIRYLTREKPSMIYSSWASRQEVVIGLAYFTALFGGDLNETAAIKGIRAHQTDADDIRSGKITGAEGFGRAAQRMADRKWELIVAALLPFDTLAGCDFTHKPWESVGRVLLFAAEIFATAFSGGGYAIAKGGYVAAKVAWVVSKIAAISRALGVTKALLAFAKLAPVAWTLSKLSAIGGKIGAAHRGYQTFQRSSATISAASRIIGTLGTYIGRRMFVNSVSNYMAVGGEKGYNSAQAWSAFRQVVVSLVTYQAFNILKAGGQLFSAISGFNGGMKIAAALAKFGAIGAQAVPKVANVLNVAGRFGAVFVLGGLAAEANRALGGGPNAPGFLQGGIIAVVAVLGFSALSRLGNAAIQAAGNLAFGGGKTAQVYLEAFSVSLGRLGKAFSDAQGIAKVGVALRYGLVGSLSLAARSTAFLLKYAVTGAVANLMVNGATNLNAGERGGGLLNGSGKALAQGAFLGVLVGGSLKAMSKWTDTAGKTTNAGRLAFEADRVKAAFSMGVWEVAFNSMEYKGTWYNPLTWMSGVSKALQGTGLFEKPPEEEQHGSLLDKLGSKFYGTFNNIFAMHAFFAFGRVGTSPVGLLGAGAGKLQRLAMSLNENALAGGSGALLNKAGAMFFGFAAASIEKGLVMPLTIKTFEIFEHQSVNIARALGMLDETGADGKDKGQRTEVLLGMTRNELATSVIKFMGFINAPIHAPQSAKEMLVQRRLSGAREGIMDFVNPFAVGRMQRGRELASAIIEAANAGGGRSLRMSDGFEVTLTGKEISGEPGGPGLKDAAISAILTPALRKQLADPKNRDAVAAVFNSEGKLDRLVNEERSEVTVHHDGRGNFFYRGADGEIKKAESKSDGTGGHVVTIEVPGTDSRSGASYRITVDKTGGVSGDMISGSRNSRGEGLTVTLEVSSKKGNRSLTREVEVDGERKLQDKTSDKSLKTDERIGDGDLASIRVERRSGKPAGADAETVGRDQLRLVSETETRSENPEENRTALEDVVRETGPPETETAAADKLPAMDKVAADLNGRLTGTAADALERAAKNPGSAEATLIRGLVGALGAERTADVLNLLGMTKQSMAFLNAVLAGGAAEKLSTIVKDPRAAANLRDLVNSGLTLPAAKLLGELLAAARPEAMQAFLRQLSPQGIQVFRDVLNSVAQNRDASRALTAMFGALDKTGGARFATMMNTLGTLDPAARANAVKNLTTFLSKVGSEGAKRFGEVLNQATKVTAQALAHMFAEMTTKGAENLATFMKSMTQTRGFANFLNALSAGKQPAAVGKLLGEIFNSLSEAQARNLGQTFNRLDAKGGQNFAAMVKSLMGTDKAPLTDAVRRLFDTVTRLEAKGRDALASILNKVADKKVVEGLAKLLSDLKDDTRQGFVNLLEQAGRDGGETLAAILQKTGEKGVNGLGEILQNNKAAEGFGRLLAQMPAGSRASDMVASMMTGAQITGLMKVLESFGGKAEHAALLARVLDLAAGKGLTPVQFAEIVGRLKSETAGKQAAEILSEALKVKGEADTLADGGKMGDELVKLAKGDAQLLAEMMLHTTTAAAKERQAEKADEFGESLVEKVLGDKSLSASQRKELLDALEKTDLARFLTRANRMDPTVRAAREALGLAEGETILVLTPEIMEAALFTHISTMSRGRLDKYLKDTLGRIDEIDGSVDSLKTKKTELESRLKDLADKAADPTNADVGEAIARARIELSEMGAEMKRLAPAKDFLLKAAAIAMQQRWGGNAGQAFAVASQFATGGFLRQLAADYKRLVRVENDGTLTGVRIVLRARGAQIRGEIREANKELIGNKQAIDIQVTDSAGRSGIAVAEMDGAAALAGLRAKFPSADGETPASKALAAAEATGLFGAGKMTVLISGDGVQIISGRGRNESALFVGRDGSFAVRTRSTAVIQALRSAELISEKDGRFILNQMKRGNARAELAFRFKAGDRPAEGTELRNASFSHGGATLANSRQAERRKALAEAGLRDGSAAFTPGEKGAADAEALGKAKKDGADDNKARGDASSRLKAEEERRADAENWPGNPAGEARFEDQIFNALRDGIDPADVPSARRLIAALENSGSSLQGRVARRLTLELMFRAKGTPAERAALVADLFRSAAESFFTFMRNVPDPALAEGFAVESLLAYVEGGLASGRIPGSRADLLEALSGARRILARDGRAADASLLLRFMDRMKGGAPPADLAKTTRFMRDWAAYQGKVAQLLESGWSMKEIAALHGPIRSLFSGERAEGNRTLRALGQELIASLGAGASLDRVEARLGEAEASLMADPADNAGQMREQIAGLRSLIGRLRDRLSDGGVDALFQLGELSRSAETVETLAGSRMMDRESLQRLKDEIGGIRNSGARAKMEQLVARIEEHVEKYDGKDSGERETILGDIGKIFEGLLESYDMNKGRSEVADLLNEKEYDADFRNTKLKELFKDEAGFNPEKMDLGQRIALCLLTSAQHFGKRSGDAIFEAKDRVENGKRGALLFQFMVGRVAGLEAGGGKTAVFVQGIAMEVMRRQAANEPLTFTAELVAFANGEVSKYVAEGGGGYKRLFRALGLEAVDGRFSDSEQGRLDAENAYDGNLVNGRVKVVITDMNTRGFRQNAVERDPGSLLAQRMKKNVLIKAMDEVDAQILSRMAFINSDVMHVASPEIVNRGRAMERAIMGAFGMPARDNPHLQGYVADQTVGYRDFGGKSVTDLSQGMWYTKIGEAIFVSEPLMKAVMDGLKKAGRSDITSGEVYEFFRAMVSVRSMETIPGQSKEAIFGFTDGAKDGAPKQDFLRPTHKKAGEFQFGQIDSSAAFNVAAVLLYRRQLASKRGALVDGGGRVHGMDEAKIDALVSLDHISLSKASASATLIQALQGGRNIHRFGATGTPDALNGIIQATLGIELTQVFSSSYADFSRGTVASVREAFDKAPKDGLRGGVWAEATKMRTSLLEVNGQGEKAGRAGEAIRMSDRMGDGILIGARSESDLIATFARSLTNNSASARLVERVSGAGSIREAVDIARRALLTEQLPEFAGDRANRGLTDHVLRTEVLDGNGGKGGSRWSDGRASRDGEAVAGAAASERLVIYSTELGLRGFSFNAERGVGSVQRVNAVLMGFETMSSESRMQAWKRVDRTKRDAVRIELVETNVLRNRVEHAQEVDSAMRQRFGRRDGLFFRETDRGVDEQGNIVMLRDMLRRDVGSMNHNDLLQLASKLSSLENLGQSAMFFINEQIESKLLKEPLTAWKAREEASGNTAGRDALADLQVQILEHSDRRDHKSGTEMTDPRRQALDAFRSSSQNVIQRLTQVARNENVSHQVRVEAMERIADIVLAERGLAERLFKGTDESGTHSGARYQSAAFVNVATDSRRRPADTVADTVVRLADLLLPTTRTSQDVSGAKGGRATSDMSSGTPRGPTGAAAAATGPAATPGAGRRVIPTFVSYAAQAESAAGIALGNMTQDDKNRFLTRLGITPAPGRTDADSALEIAKVWTRNGGTDENFDVEGFTAAVHRLAGLVGEENVSPPDAVRIAVSKNPEEETARAVGARPGTRPAQLWARGLVADIDARRAAQARARTISAGAPVAMALGYARVMGAALLDRLSGRTAAEAPIAALPAGTTDPDRRREMARAAVDLLGGLPKDRLSRDPSLTKEQRAAARVLVDQLLGVGKVAPATAAALARISFADLIQAAGSKDARAQFLSMIGARERTIFGIRIPPAVARVAGVGARVGGMAALILAFTGMPVLAMGAVGLAAVGAFLSHDASKPDPLAAMTDKFPAVARLFGKPGSFRFVATMTAFTVGLPLLGMTLAPFLPAAVAAILPGTINPALAAVAPATWLAGKLADRADRVSPSALGALARTARTALATVAGRDAAARAAAAREIKKSSRDVTGDPRLGTLIEDHAFRSKGGGKGVTLRDILKALPAGLTGDEREEHLAAVLLLLAPSAAGRVDRAKALAKIFRDESAAGAVALDQIAALEIEPLLKGDQNIGTLEAIARFEGDHRDGPIGLEEIERTFPAEDQGDGRPTVAEVLDFYTGEKLTDDERVALKAVDRAERALGKPAAGNVLKEQWDAVENGTVHERLVGLLPAALAPGAVQAATAAATAQTAALGAVAAILENAGLSRDDVRTFRSAVYAAAETRGAVAAAVNALPLSRNEQAHVLRILDGVYFGASPLGFAAAGRGLNEGDAKIVASVLNPGGSRGAEDLVTNWKVGIVPFTVAAPVRTDGFPVLTPGAVDEWLLSSVPASPYGATARLARIEFDGVRLVVGPAQSVPADRSWGIAWAPKSGGTPTIEITVGDDRVALAPDAAGRATSLTPGQVLPAGTTVVIAPKGAIDRPEMTYGLPFPASHKPSAASETVPEDEVSPDVAPPPAVAEEKVEDALETPLEAPAEVQAGAVAGDETLPAAAPTSPTAPTGEKSTEDANKPRPPAKAADPVAQQRDAVLARLEEVFVNLSGATDYSDLLDRMKALLTPAFMEDRGALPPSRSEPNLVIFRNAGGSMSRIFIRDPQTDNWSVITPESPVPTPGALPADLAAADRFSWSNRPVDRHLSIVSRAVAPAAAPRTPIATDAAPGWSRRLWNAVAGILPGRRSVTAAFVVGLAFGITGVAQASGGGQVAAQVLDLTAFITGAVLTIGATMVTGAALTGLKSLAGAGGARRAPPADEKPGAPSADERTPLLRYELPGGKPGIFRMNAVVMSAAARMALLPSERITVFTLATAARGPNGETTFEPTASRTLRTVTFRGAPAQDTASLRDLARALDFGAEAPQPGRPDDRAADTVAALLSPDSGFADWMNLIEVGPLLSGLTGAALEGFRRDPAFATELDWLSAHPDATLGEVRGRGVESFNRFVYALIAFNAESISVRRGVMMTGRTYERIAAEGPVALMHSHPDGTDRRASVADRFTAKAVQDHEAQAGLDGPGVMLVSGADGRVVGFNAVKETLLTEKSPAIKEAAAAPPPYESLDVAFLSGGNASESSLARLSIWLRGWFGKKTVPQAPLFDMSQAGDRAAANFLVDQLWTLVHDQRADAGTLRVVFNVALAVAANRVDEGDIDGLLAGRANPGLKLRQIILQLSKQFRSSTGLMYAGSTGQLAGVVRTLRTSMTELDHYGAVAALPAQERGWILRQLGAIKLDVVGGREAARRADALDRSLRGRDILREIVEPLRMLAGIDGLDFYVKLNKARRGTGFVGESDLRSMLGREGDGMGPEERRETLEVLMKLLMPSFARVIAGVAGADGWDPHLGDLDISVVYGDGPDGAMAPGTATYDAKNNRIVLALDVAWDMKTSLVRSVGLFAHEMTHPYADRALAALQNPSFGIPSAAEEAWVQSTASRALKEMGLGLVSAVMDAETNRAIVRQEEAQAVYVMFDGSSEKRDAFRKSALSAQNGGRGRNVIVVAARADFAAAQTAFAGTQVRVIPLEGLSSLLPLKGETPLEAHARLFLGTTRVRFAVSDAVRGQIQSGAAGLAAALRAAITRAGANAPDLELLAPVEKGLLTILANPIVSRLLASQA